MRKTDNFLHSSLKANNSKNFQKSTQILENIQLKLLSQCFQKMKENLSSFLIKAIALKKLHRLIKKINKSLLLSSFTFLLANSAHPSFFYDEPPVLPQSSSPPPLSSSHLATSILPESYKKVNELKKTSYSFPLKKEKLLKSLRKLNQVFEKNRPTLCHRSINDFLHMEMAYAQTCRIYKILTTKILSQAFQRILTKSLQKQIFQKTLKFCLLNFVLSEKRLLFKSFFHWKSLPSSRKTLLPTIVFSLLQKKHLLLLSKTFHLFLTSFRPSSFLSQPSSFPPSFPPPHPSSSLPPHSSSISSPPNFLPPPPSSLPPSSSYSPPSAFQSSSSPFLPVRNFRKPNLNPRIIRKIWAINTIFLLSKKTNEYQHFDLASKFFWRIKEDWLEWKENEEKRLNRIMVGVLRLIGFFIKESKRIKKEGYFALKIRGRELLIEKIMKRSCFK